MSETASSQAALTQTFQLESARIVNGLRRRAARLLARRPFLARNNKPLISFTFDDFPYSALHCGGTILEEHGVRGTYYASLGLMGCTAPTGTIFSQDDLAATIDRGHELGCHTFGHCDASLTSPEVFEKAVLENRGALCNLEPRAQFKTLSYPIGNPRPGTKNLCAKHFLGCRAGGQTFNSGMLDLNYLYAFFIEQSTDGFNSIQAIIEANCQAVGWLIFATHDVSENPTRYGCNPGLFARVVACAVKSGARILPVSAALTELGVSKNSPI